jgi:hypothetical protein
MRPTGIPPQSLRTTRMSALANRADPVIIAAALGVTFKTAAYYRNEGVDSTRHGQLVEHLPR